LPRQGRYRLAGNERLANGRLLIFTQRSAAAGPLAFRPRALEPSLCALDQEVTLELRDGSENVLSTTNFFE
jgi:hypothetical protein